MPASPSFRVLIWRLFRSTYTGPNCCLKWETNYGMTTRPSSSSQRCLNSHNKYSRKSYIGTERDGHPQKCLFRKSMVYGCIISSSSLSLRAKSGLYFGVSSFTFIDCEVECFSFGETKQDWLGQSKLDWFLSLLKQRAILLMVHVSGVRPSFDFCWGCSYIIHQLREWIDSSRYSVCSACWWLGESWGRWLRSGCKDEASYDNDLFIALNLMELLTNLVR